MTKNSVGLLHLSVSELDSVQESLPTSWEGEWLLRSGVVSFDSSVYFWPFLGFQSLNNRS